jgi:integrase
VARVTLSASLLDRLPAGPALLWDRRLQGFGVRVFPGGRTSYVVKAGTTWRALRTLEGKPLPVTPGTLRVARTLAGEWLASLAAGTDPRPRTGPAETFGRFFEAVYLPWLKTERKSWAHVEQRIRKQFLPLLEDVALRDINAFALEKWKQQRRKQEWTGTPARAAGRSAVTIDRDLADLRAMLSRAVAWGYLDAHPLAGLTRARRADDAARPVVRFLSAAEEQRLRAALIARDEARRHAREQYRAWRRERSLGDVPPARAPYTDHLHPLVLLLMNTGLRRGEALGLVWGDVQGMRLQLRGEGTKNGRSRVVPLNDEARRVLAAWKPAGAPDDALIFPGQDGETMTSVKTAFGKVLKAAQVERFRLHDLRHHFASRLVQQGASLPVVGALLGHRTPAMTQRYAHLSDEVLAAAVEKLVAGA